MRLLFILATYCAFPLSLMAQERVYNSVCGGESSNIYWSEIRQGNKIYLDTEHGVEKSRYILDSLYCTEEWSLTNPLQKTDLTITHKDGKYIITGTFHGKNISKSVKSEGYAWYQNISYNAGLALKDKKSVQYECFRPDNIELYVMEAQLQEQTHINNQKVHRVKVNLKGFLSRFWSCHYYFDLKTNWFILYRGVNGGPGTPETVTTLKNNF